MKAAPVRVIPRIKSDQQLIKIASGYFDHMWYTSARYGQILIANDKVWSYTGPDRSWRFQHHALASVSHLVDAFQLTKDKKYLVKGLEIIYQWFDNNFPNPISDMAWHDHSTAWRLINICRFYTEWKEIYEASKQNEDPDRLFEIVKHHCIKLVDPSFYMPNHNHGLDQDMALFTAANLFFELPESKEWEELSFERFNKQLDHLFGKDGSYLEHSPHYVYLLLKNLYSFLDFMYQINHENASTLSERLEKTLNYLVYILRPDGIIPSIGDSENAKLSTKLIKSWKTQSEELKVFLEKLVNQDGDLVKWDMPLDAVFFDAGVVALRNKWSFSKDTLQILIYCGFHSRVHKHHDDLSFVLFYKGIPLITEGGKYNYEYESEGRKYVVSPYAHNSVMVDEEPSPIVALNIEKSGITSTLLTKNISYVSGMHALYPKVNHRRIFVYFKPDIVLVIDKLDGVKQHIFDTFFNLHNDLFCEKEGHKFNGYLNGEHAISIENIYSSEAHTEKYLVKGQKDPLKGWISPEYGELKPNYLIQYRNKTKSLLNVFQITTGKSLVKDKKVFVELNEDTLYLKWQSYDMKIKLTDFFEHIFIKNKYYRSKKIVKPKLFESITHNESFRYL